MSVGGSGGPGGNGSTVTVDTAGGTISTGDDINNPGQWNPLVRLAHGIFASSKGGGGGQGGFAFSFAASDTFAASFAFGGSGGFGGHGGNVVVDNQSALTTYGDESHGLFAQSLGGGGGNGGFAFAGSLGSNGSLSVAFGGTGGTGGNGSLVTVDSSNSILTRGVGSYGIFAQSVGGGGVGGAAYSGSAALSHPDAKFNMNINVAVGGSGGTGGHGGDVVLVNNGLIETWGINAHGIYGQSVGGGGGVGGSARTMSLTQCWWEWSPKNVSLTLSMGGAGGAAGDGGNVTITNMEDIITHSTDSHGIWAQSVGGGGGNGGDGAHGFWGVPTVGISKTPATWM